MALRSISRSRKVVREKAAEEWEEASRRDFGNQAILFAFGLFFQIQELVRAGATDMSLEMMRKRLVKRNADNPTVGQRHEELTGSNQQESNKKRMIFNQ
jgi:hypothetical protein